MRCRSAKREAFEEDLDAATDALTQRSNGMCEVCKKRPVVVRHHKLRRSRGGTNDLDNLMHLCPADHDLIHNYPGFAYEQGWLTKGVR